LGKKLGFDFVIDRSNKLCKNNVKTVDVIKDAIKKYEKFEFENICCIYPCNPLLKVDDIKKCLKLSEKNKKKFIFPVREYSHPTERAFYLKGRNKKIK
jgi:N-acylneuraminate cytidylyltransferase|tara:strand:- start:338 stop:631 length:294 start_codon:yes stop_codon:yes gene_type:complete